MIIDLTTINYQKSITPRTCLEIKTYSDYISYGNTKELIQLKNEIKSNGFFVTHIRYAILTNFRILIYADKETFLKKKKPKNDFNIFEYDFEVEGKAFKIIKNNITVKIYYFSSISIAILWWECIKQIRVGGKIEFDEYGNQIISYNNINNNLTKKITIIENENIENITEINNHILSRNKNKNTYLRKNNSDINFGSTNLTEKNLSYNNNKNNFINTHNIINEKITTHNIINEYNISTKKSKNYDLNKTCILNEEEGNYKLNNIRKSILNNNLDDITKSLYSHKTYRGNHANSKSLSPSYIYKTKTNKRVHIEEGNNKNYYFDKHNGKINEINNKNKGKEIKSPEFKKIDETILKENASFISNNSGFLYITHDSPINNNERNNVDNLKIKKNQYENKTSNSIYKEESINKKSINNIRSKNNNFSDNEENDTNIKIEGLDINCNISNADSEIPIIIKTKPTYLENRWVENENNSLRNINISNKINNDNNNDSNINNHTYKNYQKIPTQIQSTLMNIVKTNKTTKKKYINNIKSNLNPNMVTAIIDNNNSIVEEKKILISENNSEDENLNGNQILEQDNNYDSHVFNKTSNENNSNINEYCNNGDNSEINCNENSNLLDNIIKVNKTSINNFNEETDEENTIYNNYDSSEVSNEEEKCKKNTKRENIILNSSLKNIINPDNESEISNTIPQNINIISLSNSDYGISTLKDNINGSRINLYNENTEKNNNEKSNIENSHSMLYIDNLNSYVNNSNNNVNNSNISQLYNSKIISSDNINFDLSENNNSILPSNNTKKIVSSDKPFNVSSNNNNNNILSDNIFSISSESQIINSKNNQMKISNDNPISKPANFENNFISSNIYPQNHNESKFINYDEIYNNNSNFSSNNNQSKISNYEDNKFNNSNYNEQSNNSNLYNFTKSNNSNLNNFNKYNERIYDNNSTIETNFFDINKQINNKKELNINQHKANNNYEDKQINLNTNNPYSKINLSLISTNSRLNNYTDIYNKKTRNKKESKVIIIDNENEIPLLNDNSKKNKLEYKNNLNTDYNNINYSKINIIDKIQNNENESNSSIQKSKKIKKNITITNNETYNLETKNSIYNNKNKNILNLNLNNSKINLHQRSKSNLPNHQKSLIFFENEYIFKEEKYNYINQKKQPSQLIEELLENRYSLEMLIFSVKEKTKNSTFFTKLDYNLKTILNLRSFNLVILNSLFQKFPLIYKNRLMKEDIKDYIFDIVNNNSIIHKKIRNLILNDIISIKELINSYYEEIHYSMKSNVFIEHFNNFNFEMNNISELIKI